MDWRPPGSYICWPPPKTLCLWISWFAPPCPKNFLPRPSLMKRHIPVKATRPPSLSQWESILGQTPPTIPLSHALNVSTVASSSSSSTASPSSLSRSKSHFDQILNWQLLDIWGFNRTARFKLGSKCPGSLAQRKHQETDGKRPEILFSFFMTQHIFSHCCHR